MLNMCYPILVNIYASGGTLGEDVVIAEGKGAAAAAGRGHGAAAPVAAQRRRLEVGVAPVDGRPHPARLNSSRQGRLPPAPRVAPEPPLALTVGDVLGVVRVDVYDSEGPKFWLDREALLNGMSCGSWKLMQGMQ
jgi:hypothetical protein